VTVAIRRVRNQFRFPLADCLTIHRSPIFALALLGNCSGSQDQTETNMTRGSIDGLRHTSCRTIPTAVVWCAQKRSPFYHPPRDFDFGHRGIAALFSGADARRTAACFGNMPACIPLSRPLPNISNHVIQPIAVRRKLTHRCCSLIAVFAQVLPWNFTSPSWICGSRSATLLAGRSVNPIGMLDRQLQSVHNV
jgi:hypothetical protein